MAINEPLNNLRALALLALVSIAPLGAQGLPDQSWPAGTYLSHWDHGGRIVTYHNGYLYLGATDNQHTTIYDISDPQSPTLMHNFKVGQNGHTWHKIGNAFWRSYGNPELGADAETAPFADLSNMLAWQPYTGAVHDFPFQSPPLTWPGNWLPTYPHFFGNAIYDARLGWSPPVAERNLQAESGINGSNRWRLGNLLFLTPGDDQSGIAVFDIGDPLNPVLLDTMTGNIRQYTNAWQIWRNYLVMMNGDNANGPDGNANALVIDISDPTNLTIAATVPFNDLPGRYVHFQDQFAFAGRHGHGTKFNMETMTVERVFNPPTGGFGDFQWIPLGHLLLVSSSETDASRSYLFTHQDGLDTTPPSVGYHLPVDGATNQPVTTVIGLVINEVLDSTTVNDQTIQVRPTDGDPIAGVVMDSNYDVVNWVPVQPLLPDTTYEARIIGGGIHDVAGNAIEEYVFHFSTGNEIGVGEPIEVGSMGFSPDTPVNNAQTIDLSISASGGDGALEYRWNFGDGTAAGDWQASDQTSHVFAQPGTFTVQVQVRDAGNQLQTRTRRIVVNPVAGAARPTRSDSIVVDQTNRRVWVVNPDHGSIARLHPDSLALDFEQAICANPRSVALDVEARPWVACADDHRLLRLNPANGQMALEVNTGRGTTPEAVVFSPDGLTGYASLAGSGEILRFDAATGNISDRIDVGPKPHALAVTSSGDRLLVSRLVADNDDHGSLVEIVLPALTFNRIVELPIDTTSPDSGTAARGLPNYIASLALAPDDSRLFYVAKKDNILRGQWRESTDLNFETMVRVMLGSVDTVSGNELIGQRMDLDDSSMALALTASPGGAHLFVALAGNHRIIAIDPWQGQELQRLDVGFTPRGLAIDESTGRLFVRNDLDRSVSVVDAADLMDSGLAEMSEIDVIPTTINEVLSPTVLTGKRVFWNAADTRMGADGYMSCASCHLDGGGDGRTWDFTQQGEGLRRTIPLNGRAGLSHGFVHWSANFDEIQDFEIQIRNVFGGTGFVPAADYHPDPLGPPLAGLSADLDALAAYINSLDPFGESPYRQADGSLTTEGLAGQTIFANLGCQGCHSGSAFSDSAHGLMHDVGTLAESSGLRLGSPLTGLDTPTLRGLWQGGPYLHDGRAADLHAVLLEHNPNDAHGAISGLSSTDIDNLVAYLLQIDDDEGGHPDASFNLSWQQPPHGQIFAGNATIEMGVSAELPALDHIEFLADGEIVGTRTSQPWGIAWTGNSGPVWLQARAIHGPGLTSLTRPVRVQFGLCGGPTGVLYQKWDGITGAAVSNLTSHPDFPDSPDHQWILNDLFEGPTNFDDNYGARLSGWLCAPETGHYRFWIASDDNGSLRLSTNTDPNDAVEIAFHTGWTSSREWNKYPSQQSPQIWLEAGRSYWIEALVKEASGGDNIAVGWQRPDGSLQRPISADYILRSPASPPWNPDWLFRDRFEGASRGERGRGETGEGKRGKFND